MRLRAPYVRKTDGNGFWLDAVAQVPLVTLEQAYGIILKTFARYYV